MLNSEQVAALKNPSIEKVRLLSLIEFAQQAARMNKAAIARVEQHGLFKLNEYELSGLPGIKLNLNSSDSEDELWMSVARLQETKPARIKDATLSPWVDTINNPTVEPTLRTMILGESLIVAGTHQSQDVLVRLGQDKRPSIDPGASIALDEYEYADAVRAAFKDYVSGPWKLWAEEEKRRRKTVRLYSLLFTLQQQMQEGVVETPIEIAWGVGIGIWTCNGTSISYPIFTRLCELALNPTTAAIEVRPRDLDPQLETDWYASVDNPGLGALEKSAKDFFGKATQTFSPFDPGTFEPLLQSAVTNLDPNGIYWPQQVPAEDRTLPKSETSLKITDTWVLFARPRTNST